MSAHSAAARKVVGLFNDPVLYPSLMAKVTFKRVDADEYTVLVNGKPAGALHRDEDEEFASASSYARVKYKVWDFNDFDETLPESVADRLSIKINRMRNLNKVKRVLRDYWADKTFGRAGLLGAPAFRITGTFCEKKLRPKSYFDRRSFRWIKRGSARLLVGCPKGQWDARRDRCRVGTKAHVVLRRAKNGRCAVGRKITK